MVVGAVGDIVDAHIHIFSPEVVRGRAAYLNRDYWFEQLYVNSRSRLVTGEDLISSMDAAGIAAALLCGFPWRNLDLCREHNNYMGEVAAKSNGRLAWLAIVPPQGGAAPAQEAERCFKLGASGIGECNADAQGFSLTDSSSCALVVEVCIAWDRPLMLHASEPVGHVYPGKGRATPDRLLSFLMAFPRLRVVLAHWGGGLPFYELMPEVAAATCNVVYDTAATTYLYQSRIFRHGVDVIGPDRILFGSDFPVLCQDRLLGKVRSSGLTGFELNKVLSANARRVYGWPLPISEPTL